MSKHSIKRFDLWPETIEALTREGLLLCRVVHRHDVIPEKVAPDMIAAAYPQGDFHRVYFGEVLTANADANARERLHRSLI